MFKLDEQPLRFIVLVYGMEMMVGNGKDRLIGGNTMYAGRGHKFEQHGCGGHKLRTAKVEGIKAVAL